MHGSSVERKRGFWHRDTVTFLDDTQKEGSILQVEYPNGFLIGIWAGIRTDMIIRCHSRIW